MMFSAVVLDLDGTLLDRNKNVSERNQKAIMNCYANGMKVIFATARPPRAVKALLPEELLSIGSFIFYNGALISCKTTGTDVHVPIDVNLSNELLDFCLQSQANIEISVEVKDEWYSLTEMDYSMIQRREGDPIVKTLSELKEYEPTKILITSFGDGAPILSKFASDLHMVVTDHGKLLQVMSKKASKENGIQLLCNRLGIDLARIIAFGDDHNDRGMFSISGYSVAMGNAIGELKEAANEVTANNDDDGVALVLERMYRV
ncbi:Cof-type HAD-IIB family hydrolase [Paenibacillus sp.]|uniref:Cof-type HAD-IIB family hydrolase n=1 Tax=Paenibacillus sp. TaxID=58172 RepID=UPI002811930D|nr:Cof-type HAD-IIB family hydrolase [Paenibacillus sp.]